MKISAHPFSTLQCHLVLAVALLFSFQIHSQESNETGFRPLFNGQDLSNWVPVNVAPNTFTVRDGMIVSTGKPTGILHTDRQYENFILELEWRHLHPKGNAGLFIWSEPMTAPGTPFAKSIEVQILDPEAGHPDGIATGHGDIFAIHGAHLTPDRPHPQGWERCLPSEHRVRPAGEWNHYRVVANRGKLTLAVNGKVVSGAFDCVPRKGFICLESEGSECHFRNIRIQELPSTNLPAEMTTSQAQEWTNLYNGIDLRNWKREMTGTGSWESNDWILSCKTETSAAITTDKEYAFIEFQLDWRKRSDNTAIRLDVAGAENSVIELETDTEPLGPGGWNRTSVQVQPDAIVLLHNQDSENGRHRIQLKSPPAQPAPISIEVRNGPAEFANLFIR